MSGSAVVVMLIAMVLIWGGLIFSVVHLIKNPDLPLESIPEE